MQLVNRYCRGHFVLGVTLIAAMQYVTSLPVPAAEDAAKAGDVGDKRVLEDTPKGEHWLINGREFGSSHFSPLQQISDHNVASLGLAWSLELDSPMGLPSEPLEVDGTLYLPTTLNKVYAIDAASGRVLWTADPHVKLDNTIWGSYAARIPRGVAVWEGKVYEGTGDCRIVAFDARSGKQLWDTQVCEPTQTGISGAPRVGAGKIFTGYFGSDTGTRGSLVALDADTGKIVWRFWNVPGDPRKEFENPALAMAAKTWSGDRWWEAGGAAVWDPIDYDPTTGLVVYGTAGPSNGARYGIQASGDRLFSNCVIAVNAETGQYAWHYQTGQLSTSHSPENFHIVLTT